MRNLLVLVFILDSASSFSFSQKVELEDSKNKKHKVSLKLIAARICYDKVKKKNDFVMYSYLGGNRSEEFYNSCAVVEYRLSCLGKIIPSKMVYGEMFCEKPMKFKLVESTVLYKSFSNKFKCKKIFDNKMYETQTLLSNLKCHFSGKGEVIDKMVDFENRE
jgi:hypothetical protein